MSQRGLLALLVAGVSMGPAHGQAPPDPQTLRGWELASQLQRVTQWWPGEYDNHEQVVRQSGGGLSPLLQAPVQRLHTVVRRLDVPELGTHVFGFETLTGDASTGSLRREVFKLTADVVAGALRVQRYEIAAGKALPGNGAAASPQHGDLRPLGGKCDLLLRWVGGQFHGTPASAGCAADPRPSRREIVIGARYFWEAVPDQAQAWYQGTRARAFTCHVFGNERGEMAKTRFFTTVHLHDQGGESELAWPDGRTLVFTIHNRAFSSTPEREFPLFRIHEKGNPVPLAYAYAVDDSTRFGLNLGWFYVRCYSDADMTDAERAEGSR